MDIVDANVLLYAINQDAAHHEPAHRWLEASLGGASAVGFAWVATLAFVRIATNPRILPSALELDDALAQVETWLDAPASIVVHPTARHFGVLAGLLRSAGTGSNLVNDAHLAALAVEHDATIVSFDRDFGRFPGVRHRVPG